MSTGHITREALQLRSLRICKWPCCKSMLTAATYLLGLEMFFFWSSCSITFRGPVVPWVLFPAILEDWSDFCFALMCLHTSPSCHTVSNAGWPCKASSQLLQHSWEYPSKLSTCDLSSLCSLSWTLSCSWFWEGHWRGGKVVAHLFVVLLLPFTKESCYFLVVVKSQYKNYHTTIGNINQTTEISNLKAFTQKI